MVFCLSERAQRQIQQVTKRASGPYLLWGEPGSFLSQVAAYFAQQVDGYSISTAEEEKLNIDHVRQLKVDLRFGSADTRPLVVILPQADTLSAEAANALLKLLEEPP